MRCGARRNSFSIKLVFVAEILGKRNRSKNYNRTAPTGKQKDRPGGLARRFAVALVERPGRAGKARGLLMSRAIMQAAKWGDRRSVKEAAMKAMALLFLLSVSALAVAAQSPNVDQSMPPVSIRVAKIVEFEISYTGSPASTA